MYNKIIKSSYRYESFSTYKKRTFLLIYCDVIRIIDPFVLAATDVHRAIIRLHMMQMRKGNNILAKATSQSKCLDHICVRLLKFWKMILLY